MLSCFGKNMYPIFNDIYISVDVETTGKIPSSSTLLSIGAVAIVNGRLSHDEYYATIQKSKDLWDTDTWEWWNSEDQKNELNDLMAYREKFGLHPHLVADSFCSWITNLKKYGSVSLLGDPASFDSGFIWEFLYKNSQYGQKSIDQAIGRMRMMDIRSMRSLCFNVPYSKANRDLMEKNPKYGITHNALDDARCQADDFIRMLELYYKGK